jgi:hypothetical protein
LSITFFMSCGARNWPFLMFTGLPDCAAAWMKSVWRHRNAGVCSTSTTLAASVMSSVGVHVGQHGQAEFALHLGQDLEALVAARAAEAGARGAVGLVEAALEDERDAQRRGDFLQRAGGVHLQLLGLDHAGAGDQEEGPVQPDVESAEFHASTLRTAVSPWKRPNAQATAFRSFCPHPGPCDRALP